MKKEKLKVLFIAKNIPSLHKRTNRVIYDIAHKLSAFCDIDFFYPRETVPFWLRNSKKFSHLKKIKPWNFEGFKVFPVKYIQLPFKKSRFWLLRSLPKEARNYIVKKKKIDIVHAHFLLPDGYIAYQVFKTFGIPYVLTIRNQDKRNLESINKQNPDFRKARKVLVNAKNIIVPNAGYQQFINHNFNLPSTIVPHGIEKDIFQLTKIKKNNNKITILSVADGLPTKNIDWVIKAFVRYEREQDLELILIGDVCNKKYIQNLAKKDNRIKLLGRISREEVIHYMQNSHIFALPSSKETFGLAYLEAAANKNASIGFKGEGVWGVFEENKEMLFCDGYEQFEKKLYHAIDDSDYRNQLAQNAFEKAKSMTWDKIKNSYSHLYNNAISSRI